jgi:AbrB family looped-hinge helix DNA binding protein
MARRKRRSSVDSTTLDRFGRVLIPKPVRDRLGLEPGSEMELTVKEGALVLRRHPPSRPGVVYKGGIPVFTGRIPEGDMDVVALIHRLREERHRRIAGLEEE